MPAKLKGPLSEHLEVISLVLYDTNPFTENMKVHFEVAGFFYEAFFNIHIKRDNWEKTNGGKEPLLSVHALEHSWWILT